MSPFWAICFFLALITLGIDSEVRGMNIMKWIIIYDIMLGLFSLACHL
jgi:hypothetical protein